VVNDWVIAGKHWLTGAVYEVSRPLNST